MLRVEAAKRNDVQPAYLPTQSKCLPGAGSKVFRGWYSNNLQKQLKKFFLHSKVLISLGPSSNADHSQKIIKLHTYTQSPFLPLWSGNSKMSFDSRNPSKTEKSSIKCTQNFLSHKTLNSARTRLQKIIRTAKGTVSEIWLSWVLPVCPTTGNTHTAWVLWHVAIYSTLTFSPCRLSCLATGTKNL